jgi:hypothetical protein
MLDWLLFQIFLLNTLIAGLTICNKIIPSTFIQIDKLSNAFFNLLVLIN